MLTPFEAYRLLTVVVAVFFLLAVVASRGRN